jgi:hypothetical protein
MTIRSLAKYVLAAIIAVGHPILFWVFLLFVARGSFGSTDPRVLGVPLFFPVQTNVYRINLWVYVPYALALYSLWIAAQYLVLFEVNDFSWKNFASRKFTVPYLVVCGLGYLNLYVWVIGMEGNVFGFIFGIPLLVLSVVVGILELAMFFRRPA